MARTLNMYTYIFNFFNLNMHTYLQFFCFLFCVNAKFHMYTGNKEIWIRLFIYIYYGTYPKYVFGVATISRLFKIIGIVCKRAL